MKKVILPVAVFAVIAGAALLTEFSSSPPATPDEQFVPIDTTSLSPNWDAIASWPPEAVSTKDDAPAIAEANPDPTQVTTLIILDDSGSMEGQMQAAKAAVIEAVSQFDADSRVGVIALNAGMVLPVTASGEASRILPGQLGPLMAQGTTPLGARLNDALSIMTQEAQRRRGYGIFRILVTTDGVASDQVVMNDAVWKILSRTPIELATIGLGIGEGHALNVPGFTSYVSVGSVEELADALRAAAAEQTVFQPITSFED